MFEMSTERPCKIDCSLVKYLILSFLMKRDIILDERFIQGEEGKREGEREGEEGCREREGTGCFPFSLIPLTKCLFDLPAYCLSLEMLNVASLSQPRLFLSAYFPFLLPLSLHRCLSQSTCPPAHRPLSPRQSWHSPPQRTRYQELGTLEVA